MAAALAVANYAVWAFVIMVAGLSLGWLVGLFAMCFVLVVIGSRG